MRDTQRSYGTIPVPKETSHGEGLYEKITQPKTEQPGVGVGVKWTLTGNRGREPIFGARLIFLMSSLSYIWHVVTYSNISLTLLPLFFNLSLPLPHGSCGTTVSNRLLACPASYVYSVRACFWPEWDKHFVCSKCGCLQVVFSCLLCASTQSTGYGP